MYHSFQKFSIDGDDKSALRGVLDLACQMCGRVITCYGIEAGVLVFRAYRSGSVDYELTDVPALVSGDREQMLDFCMMVVSGYLGTEQAKQWYAQNPAMSIDGSVRQGWECFVDKSRIENMGDIIRVKPAWTYYHK